MVRDEFVLTGRLYSTSTEEDSIDSHDINHDTDTHPDNKVMNYLRKGAVLLPSNCKKCSSPLVKRNIGKEDNGNKWGEREALGEVLSVDGVPFCVSCDTVVVTTYDELQILQRSNYDKSVMLDLDVEPGKGCEINVLKTSPKAVSGAKPKFGPEMKMSNVEKIKGNSIGPLQDSDYGDLRLDASGYTDTITECTPEEEEVDEEDEEITFDVFDMKKRRGIATKLLPTKMVEGYSLNKAKCNKCSMPLMSKAGSHEQNCFVCPILQKELNDLIAEKRLLEQKEEQRKEAQLARKRNLMNQLDAEKRFLSEIQKARQTSGKSDDREGSEDVQKLADAQEKKLSIIRQLQEDENEFKSFKVKKADAAKILAEEKRRELEYEKERKGLIEELRTIKEQKEFESNLRLKQVRVAAEKQKKTDRLLARKELEQEHTKDVLLKAKSMMVKETTRREKELDRAEHWATLRRQEAEERLRSWRKLADTELQMAEDMRDSAEVKLRRAKDAFLEAEEILANAQSARDMDMGYGNRTRLLRMYQEAKEIRIRAKWDEDEANRELTAAIRKLETCHRMRSIKEKQLTFDVEASQKELITTKAQSFTQRRPQRHDGVVGQINKRNDAVAITGIRKMRDSISRGAGHKIVSRREVEESLCPSCNMPINGARVGCVFCDDEDEINELRRSSNDVRDDISNASSHAVTFKIPKGCDPSDPDVMRELITQATASVKSRCVAERCGIPGAKMQDQRPVSRRSGGSTPLPRGPQNASRPSPEIRFNPQKKRHPEMPNASARDFFVDDNASRVSDLSMNTKSVTSVTMKAILSKIEDCNKSCQRNSTRDNTDLMKKLSAAAAIVRKLEASTE